MMNATRRKIAIRMLSAVALCAAAVMLPGYTFYEIETSAGPIPLRWYVDTVDVYHALPLTADAPGDAVIDALNLSMDAWNIVECDHPILLNGGPVPDGVPFIEDDQNDSRGGTNIVIFENEEAWTANHDDSEWDMSLTVALSTVFHVASTGEIRSFALEMNDGAFKFGISPPGYAFDIQNTVTHELGHVLGMDHTGTDVADYTQQTMYFQTDPGETIKRTLEVDDEAGFCVLYSEDWKADLPDPSGGCSGSTTTPKRGGALPFGIGVLAFCVLVTTLRFRASRKGRA